MNHHGIEVTLKNKPLLDPEFLPVHRFNKAYLEGAGKPLSLAVERENGQMATVHTRIYGTAEMAEADCYYLERLTKAILWWKGGFRIYVAGDEKACEDLKAAYAPGGLRVFDGAYMAMIYEHPFEVLSVDTIPEAKDTPRPLGGHTEGCRIGFDAGGSDRKVSAVMDGECLYSEEVVWFPKLHDDYEYHYEGISSALQTAAAHLPRVDAVGISSAGIFIDNKTMNSVLFNKVPEELQESKIRHIYKQIIEDLFGDVPFEVINDGDVSAIAGMMSLEEPDVLGIAMGTSEAVGYVDEKGRIMGWLNELTFVPVDCHPEAPVEEWTGDRGVGAQYFSQESVIRLAARAGISLEESLSPAEKLLAVQDLLKKGDERARDVYLTIGCYLGHTLAYYYELYKPRHVLLMGRVMSGRGGDIILEEAKRVLSDEYADIADKMIPSLPDEKFRRVGQSVAAASLPELRHK